MNYPPLIILGATGVGKSQVAVDLAARLPIEIVNADSMQVYQGFRIGTAQPASEIRSRIRHHLFDFIRWPRVYSAGDFARDGRKVAAEIQSRGCLPCIVGGTGLYIKAFMYGLNDTLAKSREVRQKLRALEEEKGADFLKAWLQEVDEDTFRCISPQDMVRIRRALEVYCITGKSRSEHLISGTFSQPPMDCVTVGLTMKRTDLYRRVERRVADMIERGWAKEVEDLLQDGIPADAHPMKAIGYRQLAVWIVKHQKEPGLLPAVIDEIQKETRHFVKRQTTWFRKMAPDVWLNCNHLGSGTASEVFKVYQSRMAFPTNHWYHGHSRG